MAGFITKITAFFLTIASFFLTLFGLPGYPTGDEVDMSKFTLTFAEEFDGNSVDYSVWQQGWEGSGITMVRKGGYWNSKMASVSDGCLHIATKYYKNGILNDGKAGWYTTALETRGKFEQRYGYYEVRCILPKGAGLWSAFWMMCGEVGNIDGSGKDGSELDIFESPFYSEYTDVVSSAVHYDGYDDAHKQKTICKTHVYGSNPYEEFNTYGMEWNENEYIFYINGKECGRSDFGGVCRETGYVILSVEVGGNNAVPGESWAGDSIDTNSTAPTDFIVDYVRVYQYK